MNFGRVNWELWRLEYREWKGSFFLVVSIGKTPGKLSRCLAHILQRDDSRTLKPKAVGAMGIKLLVSNSLIFSIFIGLHFQAYNYMKFFLGWELCPILGYLWIFLSPLHFWLQLKKALDPRTPRVHVMWGWLPGEMSVCCARRHAHESPKLVVL